MIVFGFAYSKTGKVTPQIIQAKREESYAVAQSTKTERRYEVHWMILCILDDDRGGGAEGLPCQ
jgi:hypothetical protein